MNSTPPVTVIMPILNEELHLVDSVNRILAQEYAGELDIVLAVGPSKDRTREVAEELQRGSDRVTVVDNPTGRTPAGLNAAISVARGEVIVRVDGHAMIPSDYVAIAVETLERTGADNVGGIMAAEGVTDFGNAVARAMTSKFGVGGASFHVGGGEGPALTVYLGTFRRSALDRVGGYDETMVRAQDWEMNLRIRATGGLIWFTPAMLVTYRPRATVGALARQYHDYGRWRREVVRRHPDTLSLRYLAAPVAVAAIVIGLLLALLGVVIGQSWLTILGLVPPVGYVVANLLASLVSAMSAPRLRLRATLWLPVVYATMHLTWGAGFLRGGAGRES